MGAGQKAKKGKKGKKGKKIKEIDPNAVTNVDKAFHELYVADINKKIERLTNLSLELEFSNAELEEQIKNLDSEFADLIASLKRTLYDKESECDQLKFDYKESERLRIEEDYEHQEEIIQLNEQYRLIHEQLTSELKTLVGTLTALEDFRSMRDELFEKYDRQQREMEEREEEHKRAIYEIEKKFIVAKDKLRKEMEAELVKLSTEFQEITEMRITKTTHRVVRENIAVSNEMESMLATNVRLKNSNKHLLLDSEALKESSAQCIEDKHSLLEKIKVQTKVVEGVLKEVNRLKEYLNTFKGIREKVLRLQRELDMAQKENTILGCKMRMLEQNLHSSRSEHTDLKTKFDYLKEELDRFAAIIKESLMILKTSLAVKIVPRETWKQLASRREAVMIEVLAMLLQSRFETTRRDSLQSIPSVKETYKKGDLGFDPQEVVLRSEFPLKRNVETKMGESYTNFVEAYLEDQQNVVILEKTEYEDGGDDEQEKVVTTARAPVVGKIPPIKTVFDESSEPISSSSSEQVTYYVNLPPKEAPRLSKAGREYLIKQKEEEEEEEEEYQGELDEGEYEFSAFDTELGTELDVTEALSEA